ncbi:MAG: hypothetical protein KGR26_11505 [Cyanobacteria bacterium REEB65]|nr:hypothetical protein [Cyanobacteria bacterium REEB65]
MKLRIATLDDLRRLTDALLAERAGIAGADVAVLGEEEGIVEDMDPLIDVILRQAEATGGLDFDLELDEAAADRLANALEQQLERLATAGELFQVGETQEVLRQLGRG